MSAIDESPARRALGFCRRSLKHSLVDSLDRRKAPHIIGRLLKGLQGETWNSCDIPQLQHGRSILRIREIRRQDQGEISTQTLPDCELLPGVFLSLNGDLSRLQCFVLETEGAADAGAGHVGSAGHGGQCAPPPVAGPEPAVRGSRAGCGRVEQSGDVARQDDRGEPPAGPEHRA